MLRLALLSAHYRAPLDWTGELLSQTRKRLDGLYGTLRKLGDVETVPVSPPAPVLEALSDDLNTPRALAELSALATAAEKAEGEGRREAKSALLAAGKLIGLLQHDPEAWFKSGADDDLTTKVDALIVARAEARSAKNWAEADRIRDELNALNIEVMDGPTGATWKVKASL